MYERSYTRSNITGVMPMPPGYHGSTAGPHARPRKRQQQITLPTGVVLGVRVTPAVVADQPRSGSEADRSGHCRSIAVGAQSACKPQHCSPERACRPYCDCRCPGSRASPRHDAEPHVQVPGHDRRVEAACAKPEEHDPQRVQVAQEQPRGQVRAACRSPAPILSNCRPAAHVGLH